MSTPAPHAFVCRPLLVPKPWGGRRLAALCDDAPQEPLGEAWLVADLPGQASTVASGPLTGRTLAQVRSLWGTALTGTAWPEGPVPLLVKILEATTPLSVQVHPSHNDRPGAGKEESWVVLDSGGGEALCRGLRDGVSTEAFAGALHAETVMDLLRHDTVVPGDVVDVPAGTVHAILGGVTLLEVQQPSNVTYRLYDHGRGRELHLEDGLAVLRRDQPPPVVHAGDAPAPHATGAWGEATLLLDKPAYRLERLTLRSGWESPPLPDSLRVLVLTEGSAVLHSAGEKVPVSPWQAVVIPARASVSIDTGNAKGVLTGAHGVALAND